MRGFYEIDRILRGDATSAQDLRDRGLTLQLGQVVLANVLLAAFAGICIGVFGIAGRAEPEYRFMLADAVKVPLLFFLSLAITFPSLYVFNALVGSPLDVMQLARLITAAMAVLLAVLAAFGPIVAFFSVTSTNYPFILILNVAIFLMAGGFGIDFLWRTMVKLTFKPSRPGRASVIPSTEPIGTQTEPIILEEAVVWPEPKNNPAVLRVFRLWLLAFGMVGMQMSWVLRPFIGSPTADFTWFRPRESSFFDAVFKAIQRLATGN